MEIELRASNEPNHGVIMVDGRHVGAWYDYKNSVVHCNWSIVMKTGETCGVHTETHARRFIEMVIGS